MLFMGNKRNKQKFSDMVVEVNDVVEQTYHLEQKIKEWQSIVDKNKIQISKLMGIKKKLDIKVDEHTKFVVNKHVDPEIEFFNDQLAQKLEKKKYNKIVKKVIKIKHWNSLIKLLKKHGVDPQQFKEYVEVERHVDNDAVDHLIDIGEIQIEDLTGCYKAEFNEEIKVKKYN